MMEKARTRDAGLATQVYWPSEEGFAHAAAFFAGLPYVTDVEPTTEVLVDLGFGVFQPQYRGTYDSDGLFSPNSAIDTAFDLRDLLAAGKPIRDLREERDIEVPSRISVTAAHSFGTNVLLQAILRGLEPDVAILLSPFFEFGADGEKAGAKVDMPKHVRHIRQALPLTIRMESAEIWERFFYKEKQSFPAPDAAQASRPTKLLCVVGEGDPGIDAAKSREYAEAFCDRYSRNVELVDYVVVNEAPHAQKSLLTPPVREAIASLVQR